MIELTQGTIETVVVDLTDRLGNLSTLDGSNLRFDVKDRAGAFKVNNASAPNNGMRALPLIDTTLGGVWPSGEYRLYLRFNAPNDTPVIGPIPFQVNP